ncbi:MAG: hypothetical protein GX357_02175 [Firmicutes bacterium]|nr:hypothetical protein [Bacillota bacterium]
MQEPFICGDLLLSTYLVFKGNPLPELKLNNSGQVVYVFEKTEKLLHDFAEYKNSEFRVFIDHYYQLKKMQDKFLLEQKT